MHVLEPQISVLWSPKTHAVNLTHECSRMSRICVLSPTYCWFKAQTSVLHHPEYRCCKPQVCALQPQLRVVLSPKSMPCALFRALLCARHFPKALLGAEGDKKKQPNKQGMQKNENDGGKIAAGRLCTASYGTGLGNLSRVENPCLAVGPSLREQGMQGGFGEAEREEDTAALITSYYYFYVLVFSSSICGHPTHRSIERKKNPLSPPFYFFLYFFCLFSPALCFLCCCPVGCWLHLLLSPF